MDGQRSALTSAQVLLSTAVQSRVDRHSLLLHPRSTTSSGWRALESLGLAPCGYFLSVGRFVPEKNIHGLPADGQRHTAPFCNFLSWVVWFRDSSIPAQEAQLVTNPRNWAATRLLGCDVCGCRLCSWVMVMTGRRLSTTCMSRTSGVSARLLQPHLPTLPPTSQPRPLRQNASCHG